MLRELYINRGGLFVPKRTRYSIYFEAAHGIYFSLIKLFWQLIFCFLPCANIQDPARTVELNQRIRPKHEERGRNDEPEQREGCAKGNGHTAHSKQHHARTPQQSRSVCVWVCVYVRNNGLDDDDSRKKVKSSNKQHTPAVSRHTPPSGIIKK